MPDAVVLVHGLLPDGGNPEEGKDEGSEAANGK